VIARAAAAVLAAALLLPLPAAAGKDDDFTGASVVFARGASLWRTDPRGKGPATELVRLPAGAAASAVRAIRVDAGLHTMLVDVAGRWYWTRLSEAAASDLAPLPCSGPARLTADGAWAVCATPEGTVAIFCFTAPRPVRRDVPAGGATVVDRGPSAADRELVWVDAAGVWAAPQGRLERRRKLAGDVPLRHFLPAPDGGRAVGVFRDTVTHRGKPVERDQLYTFALDGRGARRKIIRDGVPVDWSWDSQWLLVQDGSSACLMRAVGGEYKCWKGYTAVSISADGGHALLLGHRSGASKDDAAEPSRDIDEAELPDGDGAEAVPEPAVPLPSGPLSLYRVRIAGAYTERPALVERVVDGAAAWLAPLPAAP
jgi:hypothetical protein